MLITIKILFLNVLCFLLCVVRVFYTKEWNITTTTKEITNLCDSQVIKCRYIEQINKKKENSTHVKTQKTLNPLRMNRMENKENVSPVINQIHFSFLVMYFYVFLCLLLVFKKEAIDLFFHHQIEEYRAENLCFCQ